MRKPRHTGPKKFPGAKAGFRERQMGSSVCAESLQSAASPKGSDSS